MKSRKIVIWGTGKRAFFLMEELQKDKRTNLDEIVCFIDTSPKKQGHLFYGKKILSISEIEELQDTFLFVIAMADSSEPMRYLCDTLQLKEGEHVYKDSDFLRERYSERKKEDALAEKIWNICRQNETWIRLKSLTNEIPASVIMYHLVLLFLDKEDELADLLYPVEHSSAKTTRIGMFVSQFYGGGAERVVANLMMMLADRYQTVLLTYGSESDQDYPMERGIVREAVGVHFFPDPQYFFERWEEIIRSYKMDTLVFHNPYEGAELLYVMLLAKLMGIRFLVENHTNYRTFISQRGLRGHDKIYRLADHLIVVSMADQKFWRDKGCRCTYIPNPCMPAVRKNGTNFTSNLTILWVGRINQQYKNVWDVVPIMEEVVNEIPDAKLKIVGGRQVLQDVEELERRIHMHNLKKTIELCGEQTAVERYYEEADLLLMTSPGEGFPMVLAEAMSFGIPTVMYELPDLELVKTGKGIASVPQGDCHLASQMIIKILSDAVLRKQLSDEALENIRKFQEYDITGAWANVLEEEN